MLSVQDATADRWDDLVEVFGQRGDPPRCWCQWFRLSRPEFGATEPAGRRTALQAQFDDPVPPGVLGYADGEPVGWCAIALDLARRHGATVVEAYPLDTSVRAAMASELYHGPLSVFLRAGFRGTGRRSTPARPVVRLGL